MQINLQVKEVERKQKGLEDELFEFKKVLKSDKTK